MTKLQEESPNTLGEDYLKLKDKIVNGTVTKDEVEKLHLDFNARDDKDAPKYKDYNVIKNSIKDLGNSSISKENLNKFVGHLFEIETKIETDKINKGHQSTGVMRENNSVLKPALTLECVKNEFGKEIFEAVKNETPQATMEKLANIEIPPFLQSHFSKMQQAYASLQDPAGVEINKDTAARSLVFNALSNTMTNYASASGNLSGIMSKYNEVASSVYPPKGPSSSYTVLDAKINGKPVRNEDLEEIKETAQQRYNVKQEVKASNEATASQASQVETPNTMISTAKSPSFFDKVKIFAKQTQSVLNETVNIVMDNVIPGRRDFKNVIKEVMDAPDPALNKQPNNAVAKSTNNLTKDIKENTPETKNRTWQKGISPEVKVSSPLQTPSNKSNPQLKGRGGRGGN